MKALVVSESRFLKMSSGKIYTLNPILDYIYWSCYLDVFSFIYVIGRIEPAGLRSAEKLRPATGPKVSFIGLPTWGGAVNDMIKTHKMIRNLHRFSITFISYCK